MVPSSAPAGSPSSSSTMLRYDGPRASASVASPKTGDPAKVGLPLMVVGDQILSGTQESEEKVFRAWEEHLGVKPVQGVGAPEL